MRETVYIMEMREGIGEGWYQFKGVSIEDFRTVFQSGKAYIYRDIPWDANDHFSYPFDQLKVVKKYKRAKNHWGTDILLLVENDNAPVLHMSYEDFFIKRKESTDQLLLFTSAHDYDWSIFCFFKIPGMVESFVQYLKQHTQVVMSTREEDFS